MLFFGRKKADEREPAAAPAAADVDLDRFVAARSAGDLALLRERFRSAYPFPHLCVDGFLTPEFARSLLKDFPSADDPGYAEFCREDGGKIGSNYANGKPESFPPAFRQLDALSQSPGFLRFVSTITGIEGLEYDPEYFGGGIRESRAGTFLPVHIDFNHHPRTLHHRRLNLLLYLNEAWGDDWGGNIEVHLDPNVHRDKSKVDSFAPVFNRVFLFETSEISWHGFDRLRLPEGRSRRAWTIYYYTADRPNADKIKLHNTEYVEPPLPEHIRAGHTLTEDDVRLIKEGLVRRDDRIRMLYELRATFDSRYAHLWREYEYYLEKSKAVQK